MRNISAMVAFFLVALVAIIINSNPAFAGGSGASVATQAHQSATDSQAHQRVTDAQVGALQARAAQYAGRLSALEARVTALESRPVPPPAPSKPLKDQMAELERKLEAVEKDLAERPTRVEFDKLKVVVDGIAVYFDPSNTELYLPDRVANLEGRVQRLEDEPKAGLVVGVSGSVFGHDAVSDLGVTRVGAGGGITVGGIVETQELAVQVDGGVDWIASGLGGTHWHGSAVGMARRPGNGYAIGGGLMGQMTLLGEGGDTYYQSWGVGPEVRVSKQLARVAEGRKLFPTLSFRVAVPCGPVFVEGERLARIRPSLEAGATLTLKVGGRGPRR